jgi:hypothetical protein|tara:strand:+ start:688 stop:894 length:207 start_codon:yes stop_codon:yes gene_type:complete
MNETVQATVEDALQHCARIREGGMPILHSCEWASVMMAEAAAYAEGLKLVSVIYQDYDGLTPFPPDEG